MAINPADAGRDGDDATFTADQRIELAQARLKFPDSTCAFVALIEEVGELGEAMLNGDNRLIHGEAIQVATMAQRCDVDGDDAIEGLDRASEAHPHLTNLMIHVGTLAKLHLKFAAGKGTPEKIEEAFLAALDALNQLRLKGDPTIRITDATVKESM